MGGIDLSFHKLCGTCMWDVCYVLELVVPVGVSLVEGCCYHGSYWTKGSPWLSWSHHFEGCICVTGGHGCVLLVMGTSQAFPYSWPIAGFVAGLTRRMPLVERELLALLERLSSCPVFGGVRVLLAIVLAIFLWFMDSDYPFGIFKLLLTHW